MIRRTALAWAVAAIACASSVDDARAAAPTEVAVVGPRVHVGDVVPAAPATIADVDLGPAPAVGGSRMVARDDIVRALKDKDLDAPKRLPEAVRVVRKTAHLDAPEVERIVRDALATEKMPRGATLAAVRAARVTDVPDGWTRTSVELPRPPRRTGPFNTQATVSFTRGDEVLARLSVPVELSLGPEAATYDVTRGATIVLLIRRGLVEITTTGVAGADADVGALVPVLLKPSGRVVTARLADKEHAVAEGTP